MTQHPVPSSVSERQTFLDAAFLRAHIQAIRPEDPHFCGRVFLERLLDSKGPEGVAAFIAKVQRAIEDQRPIPLDPLETEIINRTYLNLVSRRAALEYLRGAVCGVWLSVGAFGVAEQAWRAVHQIPSPPKNPEQRTPFTPVKEVVDHLLPWAILGWGADAVAATSQRWRGLKLEDVASAVEALGTQLRQEQVNQQKTQGR